MAYDLSFFNLKPNQAGTSSGTKWLSSDGAEVITSYSPIDESAIGSVIATTEAEYEHIVETAQDAFKVWSSKPAPYRGQIIREYGYALREQKEQLARVITIEAGKTYQEALGEVQEVIDIIDFGVGLSRQLYGLSMHSERPAHRMLEQWHPVGIVGIITAFNFPVAPWGWNLIIALVCGNCCIWKPSEKTPLSAVVCQNILAKVFKDNDLPEGISCLINGERYLGERMANDARIALLSATGSTRMGKSVAQAVAGRLGKYLLELGGNNAIIVTEHADLSIAIPSVVFGSVGTSGQRCTTTRRLIIHKSIFDTVAEQLKQAYQQVTIGDPLENYHMGPLIDQQAIESYLQAIKQCKTEGGIFLVEGKALEGKGHYVTPSIAIVEPNCDIVQKETFGPILYLIPYQTLEEAIAIQNNVPQGLSSAIMSLNLRETELFLSSQGSDCGIANVNIGTSGSEVGGAFGGEKETGGGRETGSDAWKTYMRRQTVTINYSKKIPLAQGIKFEL